MGATPAIEGKGVSAAFPKKKNAVPAGPRNGVKIIAQASLRTSKEYTLSAAYANAAAVDLRRRAMRIVSLRSDDDEMAELMLVADLSAEATEAVYGLVSDLREWVEVGQ